MQTRCVIARECLSASNPADTYAVSMKHEHAHVPTHSGAGGEEERVDERCIPEADRN